MRGLLLYGEGDDVRQQARYSVAVFADERVVIAWRGVNLGWIPHPGTPERLSMSESGIVGGEHDFDCARR